MEGGEYSNSHYATYVELLVGSQDTYEHYHGLGSTPLINGAHIRGFSVHCNCWNRVRIISQQWTNWREPTIARTEKELLIMVERETSATAIRHHVVPGGMRYGSIIDPNCIFA